MNVKDLVLRPVSASDANAVVRRLHYSGKVVRNSQIHMGVFWRGRIEGAIQIGPPLDRRKVLGLVEGTGWSQMAELNRMAFSEALPRNAESRALGVAFRLLRTHAPDLRWLLSFADAAQCGDGTIYRAAGFVLTGIRPTGNFARLPSGEVVHRLPLEARATQPKTMLGERSYFDLTGGRYDFRAFCRATGAELIGGHQLRYIRFLDPSWRSRLVPPEIPFSEIGRLGAGMYRGQSCVRPTGGGSGVQPDEAVQGRPGRSCG